MELIILEVHVGTPIDKCREINKGLLESKESEGGYAEDVFENLIYRYEEPNGMTRWDSPLFTVPYEDETPPFEAIWEAMIGSEGKIKVVKPNRATLLVRMTEFPPLLCTHRRTTNKAVQGTRDRVRLSVRSGQNDSGSAQLDTRLAKGPSRRRRWRNLSGG